MCGVYLNRGRYVILLSFIPISIILFFVDRALIFIGQDPEVSKYAGIYVKTLIPGVFMLA